ncbi:MAG: NAD(P)H-dependent oxidoreductase [Polyangiales bacterium]
MLVIIAGKEPEKMRAAVAAVEAAGFATRPAYSEREALAAIAQSGDLFAVVAGGVIDDTAYTRIALAVAPRGAMLMRTKIGEEDPRAHFERDVVPRLLAARAARSGQARPARVAIIVGSVRAQRFADVPARWLMSVLTQRAVISPSLLDLRDFPLPFFDQAVPPAGKRDPYPDVQVERWTRAIAEADAFVMISPEYNHGYTAVLKNAIDWVYREWRHKPVAFVSYGGVGGSRAVEQLREVAVELQMVPIRQAIHLPVELLMGHARGESLTEQLTKREGAVDELLHELLFWHDHVQRHALQTEQAS